MNDKMDREITEILLKNAFEEYENKRLDEIIEKYKDTEPEYSEEHKRRMEKLFKKETYSFSWKKGLMRAAMIILAIFISGAVALQVEAVKVKLENWYYEITGEAIHIGDSIEDLPGYAETDIPIYVLSDEFVEKYGFSMTQEISDRRIESEYKNLNGKYIMLTVYSNDGNMHIDNDLGEIKKDIINGKKVFIVSRGEDETLYIENKKSIICMHTNFEKEKIGEIIENIVIKS